MSESKKSGSGEKDAGGTDGREVPELRWYADQRNDPVLAIICSDLHLSHRPPIYRSSEPNWYAAMGRVLGELKAMRVNFDAQILCAGDVFHHWNEPAELINFAIQDLPPMFAIPGQHDLPYHNYNNIQASAYWTLVRSGIITNCEPHYPRYFKKTIDDKSYPVQVWGFPYGTAMSPRRTTKAELETRHIAMIHQYVWKGENKYIGAENIYHIDHLQNLVKGYDVVAVGDNHKGFHHRFPGTSVVNCGSMMRRSRDERIYRPKVYLWTVSGRIVPVSLDTTKDKYTDDPANVTDFVDHFALEEIKHSIAELGDDTALDFTEMLQKAAKQVAKESVRKVMREIIERLQHDRRS